MAVLADSLADYSRFARATFVFLVKGLAFVRAHPVGQGNLRRRLESGASEGAAEFGFLPRLPLPRELGCGMDSLRGRGVALRGRHERLALLVWI